MEFAYIEKMLVLTATIEINAPAERCFDLTRSVDVHVASSGLIDGQAIAGRMSGLSELGDETTWSARFFGIRFHLVCEITELIRPESFADVMKKGLFHRFAHRYTFLAETPGRTRLTDELTFESPCGVAGRWFDQWVIGPRFQKLLHHRLEYLKRVAEQDNAS